jgi:hypothetical protein
LSPSVQLRLLLQLGLQLRDAGLQRIPLIEEPVSGDLALFLLTQPHLHLGDIRRAPPLGSGEGGSASLLRRPQRRLRRTQLLLQRLYSPRLLVQLVLEVAVDLVKLRALLLQAAAELVALLIHSCLCIGQPV